MERQNKGMRKLESKRDREKKTIRQLEKRRKRMRKIEMMRKAE